MSVLFVKCLKLIQKAVGVWFYAPEEGYFCSGTKFANNKCRNVEVFRQINDLMKRKAMNTICSKLIIEEKPAKLTGIVTLDSKKQRELRAFLQNLTAKGEHKPKSGSTRIITAELMTGEE